MLKKRDQGKVFDATARHGLKIVAGGAGKTRPDGEKPVADCETSVADSENLMKTAEEPLRWQVRRCQWRKAQFPHEKTEADNEKPEADNEKPEADNEKPEADNEKPEADDEEVPSPTRQTVPGGEGPIQTGRNTKTDDLKPRKTARERILGIFSTEPLSRHCGSLKR
ncbi:hypothetical protein WN51_06551 [Melipona quadrifasciata]|uniref:Uncharacterized protein n=1 Tax=Melipona quadrifasciata TaxID=166423 RepID=A0A0M8ZRH5_9HYME|nr:hypothetical protein WN51_06551 [Melipona quadrifasciata]